MLKYRFFALAMITPAILIACGEKEASSPAKTASAPVAAPAQVKAKDTAEKDAETAALIAALPAPYSTADYNKGRRQYATCKSCHLLTEEGGHRVGPNLHKMFDRVVGEAEGFKYSDALLEADFQWTPEQLNQWLANPRKFLPKNRMSFAGISKEEQRINLIAYLLIETDK